MDQYRSTNYASFPSSAFQNFVGSPDAGFRVPQHPYHAPPRMSLPTNLIPARSPEDDPLGLSQYDASARRSANDLSIEDVIKSEQSGPWALPHHTAVYQQRALPQLPTWPANNPYARSEPALRHDGVSDAADSGYHSQLPTATPTNQNDFNWNKEELEQTFLLSPTLAQDSTDVKSTVSDGRLISGTRDGRKKQPIVRCQFAGCNKLPKNQSDAKKHELTHTKPYRCEELGCSRKDGFATDNDLQRHRKSVHSQNPTVGPAAGYICAACSVPEGQKRKFWPRKDNFKAHIKRKHGTLNEEMLIERSKQMMRPDDACTVNDDNQSVRTAMLNARLSQADPDEAQGYQQSSTSPALLARHVSDPGHNAGNNLWPNLSNPEDSLAGMQGHTADLQQYCASPIDPHEAGGMPMIPDNMGNTHFPTYPPPAKRLKTDQLHWSFPTEQHQQRQVPPFQFQVSEHPSQSTTTSTSASSSQSSQTLLSPTATGAAGEFPCRWCDKVKRRECDLKKHEKRHTRPYGCTFPACHKKFGSRNDWKRHESSQHFIKESYKCRSCASLPLFSTSTALRQHLLQPPHNFPEQHLDQEISACKLGRDGYDHFWCGFCQKLIEATANMVVETNAWDERFRHIGEHFDKEGLRSEGWVCVEANRPLGELKKEANGGEEEEEEEGLPEWNAGFENANGAGYEGMYMSTSNKRKLEDDNDAEGDFEL